MDVLQQLQLRDTASNSPAINLTVNPLTSVQLHHITGEM